MAKSKSPKTTAADHQFMWILLTVVIIMAVSVWVMAGQKTEVASVQATQSILGE